MSFMMPVQNIKSMRECIEVSSAKYRLTPILTQTPNKFESWSEELKKKNLRVPRRSYTRTKWISMTTKKNGKQTTMKKKASMH